MIETTARRQVPIFGGRPLGQRVRLAAGSIRGTLATVIHVLHSTARRPKHSWRRSGIPGNARSLSLASSECRRRAIYWRLNPESNGGEPCQRRRRFEK